MNIVSLNGMFQDMRLVGKYAPKNVCEHAQFAKTNLFQTDEIVVARKSSGSNKVFARVLCLVSQGLYRLITSVEPFEMVEDAPSYIGKISCVGLPTSVRHFVYQDSSYYALDSQAQYTLWLRKNMNNLSNITAYVEYDGNKEKKKDLSLEQIIAITDGKHVLVRGDLYKSREDGDIYVVDASSKKIIKVDQYITDSGTKCWDYNKLITPFTYVKTPLFITSHRKNFQYRASDCAFSFDGFEKKRKRDVFES